MTLAPLSMRSSEVSMLPLSVALLRMMMRSMAEALPSKVPKISNWLSPANSPRAIVADDMTEPPLVFIALPCIGV